MKVIEDQFVLTRIISQYRDCETKFQRVAYCSLHNYDFSRNFKKPIIVSKVFSFVSRRINTSSTAIKSAQNIDY